MTKAVLLPRIAAILAERETINVTAAGLFQSNEPILNDITVSLPHATAARGISVDATFIRLISWLYVLYNEAGKEPLDYLLDLMPALNVTDPSALRQHMKTVHSIRTCFHHNLDLDLKEDLDKKARSDTWFKQYCKYPEPQSSQHWLKCLAALLTDAEELLRCLKECLEKIDADPYKATILAELKLRLSRTYPLHRWVEVCVEVLADHGREELNAQHFCATNNNYEKWTNHLKSLTGNYDFQREARRLIEKTLHSESNVLIPITGNDIMLKFNIPQGPSVGRLWKKAKELYAQTPCSKEELLDRLQAHI